MLVENGIVYLLNSSGVQIVDARKPEGLKSKEIYLEGYANNGSVYNYNLYLPVYYTGIIVINTENFENIIVDTIPQITLQRLAVSDTLLFGIEDNYYLSVWNIKDQQNPIKIDSILIDLEPRTIYIYNNFIYLLSQNKIYVYGFTNNLLDTIAHWQLNYYPEIYTFAKQYLFYYTWYEMNNVLFVSDFADPLNPQLYQFPDIIQNIYSYVSAISYCNTRLCLALSSSGGTGFEVFSGIPESQFNTVAGKVIRPYTWGYGEVGFVDNSTIIFYTPYEYPAYLYTISIGGLK